MHSLEEFEIYNSITPRYEEEDRCLCFEHIRLSCIPKALGHIDEAVTDLFDQLDKRVTPVPTILKETFRSLNAYRRAGEVATPRRDDILEEKWMAIFQNLREEDVEWRALWLLPYEILYR
ncbi:hypothetical protein Goshw_028650 [Gossypium schwendimanii]|uniref:Uncharacterized protein n=1 Tax=Gossypium schwendimanii TaxID=34291 RepID=A0A7J9N427_GOSSC|nr:hypothetical protein [Gossypium schwendimanii]